MVTWPSAINTALLSLRTHKTVVPCICALPLLLRIHSLYRAGGIVHRRGVPNHAKHSGTAKRLHFAFLCNISQLLSGGWLGRRGRILSLRFFVEGLKMILKGFYIPSQCLKACS